MPGPTRYSLFNYGAMVTCEPRMSAYAAALRQAITPGCTVIDLGAGPGVFSLLACQYGASSVIAVEPDESVQLLRKLAADNGCADRITIFQGLSTDLVPRAKADVIVSDIRGCLPFFESHVATITDARERLLAPGGKLIPARDRLRIALVESARDFAARQEPWASNTFGLNLSGGLPFAASSWTKVTLGAESLLSNSANLATLDYYRIAEPDLLAGASLEVTKAGTLHGLLVWFDTELAPGIGFSNAPGEPPQIYGQTFLPLDRSLGVLPGDCAEVEFRADLIDGAYVWGWSGTVRHQDRGEFRFDQSSFHSKLISPDSLHSRASNFAPPALAAHDIDRLCLSLIDGQRTLAEIAARLRSDYPAQFPDSTKALNHVVELTNRYR